MKLTRRFKIICAAVCVGIAIMPLSAFAEWRQISGNRIIISDKIEMGKSGRPVTINVLKPGSGANPVKSDIIFHAQTLTTDGGNYEFVFEIPTNSGSYTAHINADGKKSSTTINFEKETVVSGGNGGGTSSGSGKGNNTGITIPPNAAANDVPTEINKDIFDDLNDALWAKEAIINLAEKGIVSGKTEHTFCPNQQMTREEFAKVIVDAFLKETQVTGELSFSDTDKNAWYYIYVAKAYFAGAVSGKDNSLFGIGEYITREDMAAILYRILKDQFQGEYKEHLFADSDEISAYAKEAVTAFYQNQIISGMGENRFAPKEYATRAQVAKIVSGLLDIL